MHLSSVAQPRTKTLAFNTLTIHDGLSQGMVTSIFQDRFGYILKGNGILNMTSRAKLLKGALAVNSSTGEGTTLTLRFKV